MGAEGLDELKMPRVNDRRHVGTVGNRRHAENTIARLKQRNVRANRLDLSGKIHTEDRAFGPSKPPEQPGEKRLGPEQAAIGPADRR